MQIQTLYLLKRKIAMPSKVDNVERVFNGYKKKYVDKVNPSDIENVTDK
jgi:hypothetical protein